MADLRDFCIIIFWGTITAFIVLLERTIWRHKYIGYYDWPNRSLEEYQAECERLHRQHQKNWPDRV